MAIALGVSLLSSLTLAVLQNDLPTVAWQVEVDTAAPVIDHVLCTDAAADLLVLGGELRDGVTANTLEHHAFVRAVERTTGVERWRHVDDTQEQTLAVAVDGLAGRVYAIARTAPIGATPGSEHFLVLDAATGNVLLDVPTVLPVGQPLSTSQVDALELSPDGTRLHRLDFTGTGTNGDVWTRALDTASGAVLWVDVRTGLDAWEFRKSTTESSSLTVSPSGAAVYVTFETVDPNNAFWRDTHVLALAAASGAQNWLQPFGSANAIDRITRPVVALDSSAVFVGTTDLGAAAYHVRRLDALDGSTDWSVPCDHRMTAIELAPSGADLVLAGTVVLPAPNHSDVALQSFDAATGTSSWSVSIPGPDSSDDVVDVAFAPNGSRVHVYAMSDEVAPPFADRAFIASVDAATGLSPWSVAFAPTTEFTTRHWLDAAALSPSLSLVSCGEGRVDTSQAPEEIGIGSTERRALDADTGALVWNVSSTDTLPFHSDAALRVWLEPGDQVAVVWVKSQPIGFTETFVLERRDVATGALLSTFQTQNLTTGSGSEFKPSLSHDRRFVALERTSIFGRHLTVFDIQTGAPVYQRDFLSQALEVYTTWDPNDARVHYATRGVNIVFFGVADAVAGTSVWEQSISFGTFFFGSIGAHGLAVDPHSGDQVVSYDVFQTFPSVVSTNYIARRDATTGSVDWTFVSPNVNTTRHHRDHSDWSSLVLTTQSGEELTAVQFSPDGTRVLAIDTFLFGASTKSRFAALDAATGDLLWVSNPGEAVGHDGRTIDFTASLDGRFAHVLSEGRGASALSPRQLMLSTFSQVDGSFLWMTWIAAPEGRARRIASIGNGGRVAVLGNADTDSTTATGGFLSVFDAENGVELVRHTVTDAERGDLCDVAFAVDRTAVLVGSRTVSPGNADAVVLRLDPRTLTQGPDFHSLALGGHNEYHVDFDAALAGHVYLVVGSVSGITPGLPLAGGWVLPLNHDAYTVYTQLTANGLIHVNSLGLLDSRGDARMRLFVPAGADRIFAGLPFAYAAVAVDPLAGVFSGVTNAAQLDMQL